MQEEKKRKQDETKAMLDYAVKLKMKRKARDVQEELAMDMKILEQMLAQTNNEAKEELEKKVPPTSPPNTHIHANMYKYEYYKMHNKFIFNIILHYLNCCSYFKYQYSFTY